jgi:hypothetical protein
VPLREELFGFDGLPLPRVDDELPEELADVPGEVIADYGEALRLQHIAEAAERQAARAKEAYGLRQVYPPPDPANDRAARQQPAPERPLPPEPKRLKNAPPPSWNQRLKQWEPAHFYHPPSIARYWDYLHAKRKGIEAGTCDGDPLNEFELKYMRSYGGRK